jgi:hypothetical protein
LHFEQQFKVGFLSNVQNCVKNEFIVYKKIDNVYKKEHINRQRLGKFAGPHFLNRRSK